MSVHIGAQPGDIAERVLLPGDPMRAKWIAETFLKDPVCYTQVRGMLGFTGTWQGVPVSVQGSGMGMPSASIYTHELINEYGVKSVLRIGSCGAPATDLQLGDVVAAVGSAAHSEKKPGPLPRPVRQPPGGRFWAPPAPARGAA